MNRSHYFDYIEEKFSILATRIDRRGKLNVLDLHLHSENFFLHLFNELFGWNLKNKNAVKQNVEAIDLIDDSNKIIVQVSATSTKQKIESALTKDLSAYSGFSFKFISISKDASELRKCTFKNPPNINFTPQTDIYDPKILLSLISTYDIGLLRQVYDFIKSELGNDIDEAKIETNLASVINVIAKEDWDTDSGECQIKPFEIDQKIEFNSLSNATTIIADYSAHSNRVNKIYSEFNKQGVNKSSSVHSSIRKVYLQNIGKCNSNDDLFFNVIELLGNRVRKSANYTPIPFDELEHCLNILVVDAFIRCKIFENPEGYMYVAT